MKIELPAQVAAWLREYQASAAEEALNLFVAESVIHDLQGCRAFLNQMGTTGQPDALVPVRPIKDSLEWDPEHGPTKVSDLTTEQLTNLIQNSRAMSEWLAIHAEDLEAVLEKQTDQGYDTPSSPLYVAE